jgi:hypothetical protein
MAKTKFNPLIEGVSGKLGRVIVKKYKYGQVLSKKPDMSGVTFSPKQQARQLFMQEAVSFYRETIADPVEKARYAAVAEEKGLPISALTLQEFARRRRAEAAQPGLAATPTSLPAPAADGDQLPARPGSVADEIGQTLARLNTLLAAKDPAIAAEFATSADVLLVGSEAGEVVVGSDALPAFFQTLFALPLRLAWEWRTTRVTSCGSIAWIFADGEVVLDDGRQPTRKPYRLSGVLEKGGRWRWRMFHGADPR